MPNFGSLEELWRRSVDLNVRFYVALGRLTVDYLKDLTSTLSEVRTSPPARVSPSTITPTGQTPPQADAPTIPPPAPHSATMLLEGEAGSRVPGVFLVENHMSREISARIVTSSFVDTKGREVRPVMLFEPETVVLGPGEQLLMRVVTVIDETLEPDVRYMGQFIIPELVGTRIPVALRRRSKQNTVGAQTLETAQASTDVKSKKKISRSRSAKAKRSRGTDARTG